MLDLSLPLLSSVSLFNIPNIKFGINFFLSTLCSNIFYVRNNEYFYSGAIYFIMLAVTIKVILPLFLSLFKKVRL